MTKIPAALSLIILIAIFVLALTAPFVAPYSARDQFREHGYAPPQALYFRDTGTGRIERPYFFGPEGEKVRLRLLVSGTPYQVMGIGLQTRLIGTRLSDPPFFLLGSDSLGRDLFSRTLHGARFTLTISILGIVCTLLFGVGFGLLAGYAGGWIDAATMRMADLLLSLPGLFLVLGLRAVFPLEMSVANLYLLMTAIFTLAAWGGVARVVRGQTLSLKARDHVQAARVLGASHGRILLVHILPFTTNYLIVQMTILVPAFILGEITLSFLGVGIQEPNVSWGTLLNSAASVSAFTLYPWLLWPVAFIFLTILAFNFLGDSIKALGKQAAPWI